MSTRNHRRAKPTHLLKTIYATPLNVYKNNLGIPLDLSYITTKLIVCSYPVTKYPKLMYRNSLEDLVSFLNLRHGPGNWKIYNFKVERGKSDYEDKELEELLRPSVADCSKKSYFSKKTTLAAEIDCVLNRVGWMDHSPPPFTLLQEIIDDINTQLCRSDSCVAVLHCKMGKGRSGTICIAYMMKYMACPLSESRDLFMNARFKPGISRGVTILSQLRWLRYHEMFLYYEPDVRSEIMKQLAKSRFKICSVQLREPSSVLFSHHCVASIKLQLFNEARDSVIDVATLETDAELLSHPDDKTITICFPLEVDASDIRLEFGISARSQSLMSSFTALASYAHCWLNLYWETLKCSREHTSDYYSLSNLRREQAAGQEFFFVMKWSELDGTCGTSNRGLKLFESLTLKWSLV
ncbi:TEP1 (YNL128W) [Zygosaccharomyces parabailii]|nr:TEP1 (YNL128W) [Zygosaccharomyces parabailii]CDH17392.1 related to phosphatidylinositol 3,4,5-trisphosphate 3-phosphatase TEP1 [Zygosaccharomyces bailii ISA1307]